VLRGDAFLSLPTAADHIVDEIKIAVATRLRTRRAYYIITGASPSARVALCGRVRRTNMINCRRHYSRDRLFTYNIHNVSHRYLPNNVLSAFVRVLFRLHVFQKFSPCILIKFRRNVFSVLNFTNIHMEGGLYVPAETPLHECTRVMRNSGETRLNYLQN